MNEANQLPRGSAAVCDLGGGGGSRGVDGGFVVETVEVTAGGSKILNPSLGLFGFEGLG
jgi:hypothetical protein